MNHPRIMIVDRSTENRELLRRTIEPAGYDVYLVPAGEVALIIARKVKPDLILLGVNQQGVMDGFEVCERLKRDSETREIPVILLTELDRYHNRKLIFQSGAVDYIEMPFSRDEVLARIGTHVTLVQAKRELRSTPHSAHRMESLNQEEIQPPDAQGDQKPSAIAVN